MERVFSIDARHHGKGPVIYSWHPSSRYVATSGSTRLVFVFDHRGKMIEQIAPPGTSVCLALEWDAEGQTLAILQGGTSHEVLLWDFGTKEVDHVDLNVKDPTFMKWSKIGHQLAIGTGRGDVLMYDKVSKQCWYAAAKHKKRITCGDWNSENKFAFASDDRQITIATADGKTFGQVKVKSRPTNVKFGGNSAERENIVSVSMDRKTILLYNLDDPENALELAFQQRYGHIVAFNWFRDGYVMVGFSLGYLVVISTHLAEIGREQFCARFHKDALRDIAYCPSRHKVATCGDSCIKIVDMKDWKEHQSEELEKSCGPLDKLVWTTDGNFVSVSSRTGSLYVYAVEPSSEPFQEGGSSGAIAHMVTRPLSSGSMFVNLMIVAALVIVAISYVIQTPPTSFLRLLFETQPF